MSDMNICPMCGSDNINASNDEVHNLAVMGLPNVFVVGMEVSTCANCGESFKEYPITKAFKGLVVKSLVTAKRKLTGKEFAFIRKTLGYKAKEWASIIGVHHVTVSDWETGKSEPNITAEVALRLTAALAYEINRDMISSTDESVVDMASLPLTVSYPKLNGWGKAQIVVNQ